MTKWTTLEFITRFFDDRLGRKRVHGTYRVLEGDYCKLLVRATVVYGTPSGNHLIAIDLSDNKSRMVFWKNSFGRNFSYRASRNIERSIASYQALPELILSGDEENILNSGIVDITDHHALIEIGDKPFLLHRDMLNTSIDKKRAYTHANQVPNRVASIREALDKVKDPITDRKICQEWWAKEMPLGFTPPKFDPELVKVLSTALNPLDFGFDMDECRIANVSTQGGYESSNLRAFYPKKKVLQVTPTPAKVQRWIKATAKWADAADKLLGRKPPIYKGLSVQNSRFTSLTNDEDRLGTIIITGEGVYLTGEIHSKNDWVQSDTLTKWYKLTQHANQINIPKCI